MRPIDADVIIRSLEEEYHGMLSDESMKIYQILKLLDDAPTIEMERPTGKWLESDERETWCCFEALETGIPKKYKLPACSQCSKEFGTVAFFINTVLSAELR